MTNETNNEQLIIALEILKEQRDANADQVANLAISLKMSRNELTKVIAERDELKAKLDKPKKSDKV